MNKPLVTACLARAFLLAAGLPLCALADDDLEKYQALRKQAAAEIQKTANEVRIANELKMKEAEARLAEVRKWTNSQFELGERHVIDKPKAISSLMKHWQAQRQTEFYRLLQFPEKSGGAIESGRALNAMLERVGASAFQNAETRKIKPDAAVPLTDAGDYTQVTRELAEEVSWQENVGGAKLVGQGSRGPLDLDWPAVLREERWAEHRKQCDEAGKQALAEIASPSGLSGETDAALREAIGSFNSEFSAYRSEWVGSDHPNVDRALEYRRICDGTRHIQKLVVGVYQLVELTRYQTIQPGSFPGGNIEEYIAYFQRNNLRFAPAGPAHRSAYYRIFTMMVRYYLDQKMAVNLERQLERELSGLKRIDRQATDAALGRTMSASDQAAIRILELKNIYELLK